MALLNLTGKKGLIIGVANNSSIAFGCAKALSDAGSELIITIQNERSREYVEPYIKDLNVTEVIVCDVTKDEDIDKVFAKIKDKWGKLDYFVHSVAFAKKEDLTANVAETSREGFSLAMDISCHSFMRFASQAKDLMPDGGAMITMSYHGAERAIENYGIMGPVKSALECSVRYLAVEMGQQNIRVFSISPGPIKTRAATGLDKFDDLMEYATRKSPLQRLVTIEEVGNLAAFLSSPLASGMTGLNIHVDCGFCIVG